METQIPKEKIINTKLVKFGKKSVNEFVIIPNYYAGSNLKKIIKKENILKSCKQFSHKRIKNMITKTRVVLQLKM